MALDDLGNDRIDFVWGNMPLQRNYSNQDEVNFRTNNLLNYPGDGEAEYYLKGHSNETVQSSFLDAGDSHTIALRQRFAYPQFDPNVENALTVNWWVDDLPAYQYPNIIGKKVEDAVKDLIECGVNPAVLVPLELDGSSPINAPGADNPGVIIYRYYEPGTQIGNHWDGSPWYAEESENCVIATGSWIGEEVAVDEFEPDYFSNWHSFVVLQTKDPELNTWTWWD